MKWRLKAKVKRSLQKSNNSNCNCIYNNNKCRNNNRKKTMEMKMDRIIMLIKCKHNSNNLLDHKSKEHPKERVKDQRVLAKRKKL
jgi:hypothetical protein